MMIMDPVDESNIDRAISVLAAAFHDDPVLNWVFNNPSELDPFFEITLPSFLPHGLTYIDSEGCGVASWSAPSQKIKWSARPSNIVRALKIGRLTGLYRMLLSGVQTERHHPKPPHYYLFAIGVTPQNKGSGIGSSLISHVLRRCDAEGMPAYLENSKEANLPFYEGHGFKVMKEIRFAASAPPLWLMWREPQPDAPGTN